MSDQSAGRRPRRDLRAKLDELKARSPAGEKDGKRFGAGTWKAFQVFTGIARRSVIYSDDVKIDLEISEAIEGRLAVAFNFDPSCSTWIKGSCVEFCKRWPRTGCRIVRRLTAHRIPSRGNTLDRDRDNVFVNIFFRHNDSADTATFDGELVCQPFTPKGMDRRVKLAIERGLIIVTCPIHLVPPMQDRLGGEVGGVLWFERKANTVTLRATGRDRLIWQISVDRPPIGIVGRELVELFKLGGCASGDQIEMAFVVEDEDLVTADGDSPAVSIEGVDGDGGPIVMADGRPLGRNKQQVMAHLAKLSIDCFREAAQDPGTAIICRDAIELRSDGDKVGERSP